MTPSEKIVSLVRNAPQEAPKTGPAPGVTAFDPCSHVANAQRLVREFADRLLYVDGIGWHTWGPPWRHDPHGAAELVHGLGKIIAAEAASMASWVADASRADRDEREHALLERLRWARKCELAGNIEATLETAKPYFAIKAEQLDADPDLLGCANGVLDLKSLEFREHRQSDHVTKVTGCDLVPDASAPMWEKFLADVFEGDAELVEWFQRFIGYTLSGHRNQHLLPILWGGGSNGKSTALGALQAMFGDYGDTAAETLLIQKFGSEHPTQIAALQGKRFVVASESSENGRLNEERVKAITGGDKIRARRMRMDGFTFDPTHQLVLQTNHKPKVTGTDEGIWRRLRLIPFTRKFTGKERDPELLDKLKAELPGILKWAVHGWSNYRLHGLGDTPERVKAATAEYRGESDAMGAFLEECCEIGTEFAVQSTPLFKAYEQWCMDAGERAKTRRDFGLRLSERGFRNEKVGVVWWRGLRLSE
jgi:putative DNA primase/helicase